MGTRVKKELLRPGTFFTRRGPVTFSPEDLRQMEVTGNLMIRHGLRAPCPLEHQDVVPMSAADALAASVKHNAGWVAGFSLDADGSLWADLDIEDDEIARKLPTTIKFVSPQVHPVWYDGSGREWRNAVTHVALTPSPVFAQQKPFGGDGSALLSLADVPTFSQWPATEPIRLSLADCWQLGWTRQQSRSGGVMAVHSDTGEKLYGKRAERALGRESPTAKPEQPPEKTAPQQPPAADQQKAARQAWSDALMQSTDEGQTAEQRRVAKTAADRLKPDSQQPFDAAKWHQEAEALEAELQQNAQSPEAKAVLARIQQVLASARQYVPKPGQQPTPAAQQQAKPAPKARAARPKAAPAAAQQQSFDAFQQAHREIDASRPELAGTVPVGELYQRLKAAGATASPEQFKQQLQQWESEGKVRLRVHDRPTDAEREVMPESEQGALGYARLQPSGEKPAAAPAPAPKAKAAKPAAPKTAPADHGKTLAAAKGKSADEVKATVAKVAQAHLRNKAGFTALAQQHGVEVKKSWTGKQIAEALTKALAGAADAQPTYEAGRTEANARAFAEDKRRQQEKYTRSKKLKEAAERKNAAQAGVPVKQSHEMTRDEFRKQYAGNYGDMTDEAHQGLVQKAIAAGKSIPPDVLKDYPELAGGTETKPAAATKAKAAAQSAPAPEGVQQHVEALKKLYDGAIEGLDGPDADAVAEKRLKQAETLGTNLRKLKDADVKAVAKSLGVHPGSSKGKTIEKLVGRITERMDRYTRAGAFSKGPQSNPSVERTNLSLVQTETERLYHRLSRGDDMAKEDEDDLFAGLEEMDDEGDAETPEPDGDETPPPPMDEPVGPAPDASAKIAEAVNLLSEHGIVVDPGDDPVTFLDHLCTALKTHSATKAIHGEDGDEEEPPMPTETPAPEPLPVAMSLRVERLESQLADERLKAVAGEVKRLVKEGRVQPSTAKQWGNELTSRRLSLVNGEEDVKLATVLAQIDLAKATPAGTFWSAERRATRLSQADLEPEPNGLYGNDDTTKPDPEVMRGLTRGKWQPPKEESK